MGRKQSLRWIVWALMCVGAGIVASGAEQPADSKVELVLQTGHAGKINFTVLSPDGLTVATGSEDKTVILWDADTGQQVHTLRGYTEAPDCGAFSPDGRELVTACYVGGMAVVWDVESGRRLRSFELSVGSQPRIVYTPDGKRWITKDSQQIAVWDPQTGNCIRSMTTKPGYIHAMAVSPDAKQVMAAIYHDEKPRVVLWDVETGKETLGFPGLKGKQIWNVAFTPDGKRVAHSWNDKEMGVVVWDLATLKQVCAPKLGFPGSTVFTPGGREAVTLQQGDVAVWDAATGQIAREFARAWGRFMLLSPDGGRIYYLNGKHNVAVDPATDRWIHSFAESGELVNAMVTSDGSRIVMLLEEDSDREGRNLMTRRKEVVVRDAQTGREISRAAIPMNGSFKSTFSPDGQIMVAMGNVGYEVHRLCVWNVSDGRLLKKFKGPDDVIQVMTVSVDGRRLLTAGSNFRTKVDEVLLWDLSSEQSLRSFAGLRSQIWRMAAAISPDGRKVFASDSSQGILWDAETGRSLHVFPLPKDGLKAAAFTPDNRRLLLCEAHGGLVTIRDVETGSLVRSLDCGVNTATLSLSGDGRRLLTGGNGAPIFWDLDRALPLSVRCDYPFESIALSPDGHRILLSGDKPGNMGVFWDLKTGLQSMSLRNHVGPTDGAAFSPDGRRLATVIAGHGDRRSVVVWDLASGRPAASFGGLATYDYHKPLWSLDGRRLAVCERGVGRSVVQCDLTTGREMHRYASDDNGGYLKNCVLTADGRRMITVGGKYAKPGSIRFWDADTGRQLDEIQGHQGEIKLLALSPDGRTLVTASERDKTAIAWDVVSHRKLYTLQWKPKGQEKNEEVRVVTFSPDGREVITSFGRPVVAWNADDGRLVREFFSPGWNTFVPNPKGRVYATHSDERIFLCSLADGKTRQTLQGHTGEITSLAFNPDGRRLASTSKDGTTRIWDVEKGTELIRLVAIDGGEEWVATTPDGLFDGSPGSRQLTMFRVPGRNRPVPIDRFFKDFYRPELLATAWGGQQDRPEVRLGQSLPPTLKILSPRSGDVESNQVAVEAEAVDQGGGVSDLSIYQNGSRVLAPGAKAVDGKTVRRTFRLVLVEGENRLRVHAASGDGSWEAEPAEIVLRYEKPLPKSELYLLAIGISRYADAALNLQYAANDAKAMADLFTRRGKALYQTVHPTMLLDQDATRERIKDSLGEIGRKTSPQDTLVVFLAGHGTMLGQRYYFIPHGLRRQAGSLEEDIRKQGLPGDELSDLIGAARAIRRIQIYDTCASGGALALERKSRAGFALRGAIERLARTQGIFTIAAASAGEEAMEAKELGHGVLSYALLAGMKSVEGGPLEMEWIRPSSTDQVIDVLEWFTFAANHVPRLTQKLHGAAQDVPMSVQGKSFPVLPLEH